MLVAFVPEIGEFLTTPIDVAQPFVQATSSRIVESDTQTNPQHAYFLDSDSLALRHDQRADARTLGPRREAVDLRKVAERVPNRLIRRPPTQRRATHHFPVFPRDEIGAFPAFLSSKPLALVVLRPRTRIADHQRVEILRRDAPYVDCHQDTLSQPVWSSGSI